MDYLTRYVSQRKDKEFMYVPGHRRINPAVAQKILALKIPGVFSQREFRRFYPQGEAVAHVLGFTNIDDQGQEGVELAFDEWLRGKPGLQKVIRDRHGRIVEHVDLVRPAEPGKDLVLSIDRRIQFLAYRELKRTLLETRAASGSVVILDVATGEVLAMANLPSYNNNKVSGENRDAYRNRAVTDLFEPGSTIKPLTVAAGLEAGVITPTTLIDTNPGWIPNGRYRTSDFRNYGVLDVTGVLTKSSNVGVSKIVRMLPDREFDAFLRRFGFGSSTGSGSGEAPGTFPTPDRWSGTHKQTLSYGYGLPRRCRSRAYAHRQRRVMVTPTFVKGGYAAGRCACSTGNRRPGDADDADRHRARRHRHPRRDPGYHVAGKTGTARKSAAGGYAPPRRLLRRPGAGGAAAVRGHGGGQRPRPLGRRFDLRRWLRVRAAVRAGDGGRVAADGRAAGRHRHLAGRAGGRRGAARARARRRGAGGRRAMRRSMPLAGLLPDVAGIPEGLVVTGLALDSRELQPGHAFIAVAGFGRHGLHFAADAARRRAAILFEPPVPGDVPPLPPGAIAVPGLRARQGSSPTPSTSGPRRG